MKINTLSIKQQQLQKGFLTTGSGKEVVLIMGSCRVVNFVNYMNDWNEENGNRFTIHSIDPFSFNWDINENRVDYEEELLKQESNPNLLEMLTTVNIFISEWYQNAGMFNVFKEGGKNIFQFGLNPELNICIPNWNDIFVLVSDIVTFDLDLRKKCIQDWNVLGKISDQTVNEINKKSTENLNKFFKVCSLSSVPEFGDWFAENFTKKRLWWTFNHTSKEFTLSLFKIINEKFLHLDLSKGFDIFHEDMFANNYTKLCDLDFRLWDYQWQEEIVPIKDKLFG